MIKNPYTQERPFRAGRKPKHGKLTGKETSLAISKPKILKACQASITQRKITIQARKSLLLNKKTVLITSEWWAWKHGITVVQKENKMIMIGLLRKVKLVRFKRFKHIRSTLLERKLVQVIYFFTIVFYLNLKKRKIIISTECKITKSVGYLGYQLKKSKNKVGHQ